jgi:hypothetical protein
MEAILKYDLNDSDDTIAHLRAVKSTDMAIVLWEIVYNMRKKIESQIEAESLDGHDALDKIYERIIECMSEHGIKIDELIV